MSRYELFLVGGSAALVLAVVMFFSAATKDMPLQKSLAVFMLGSVLLYFADQHSAHGIQPGDIPGVFATFIKSFF